MCKHLRWMDIYTHRTTSSPAWGDFTGEGKPEVCYLMPHGQRHTAAQTLHCEASTTPTSPQLKLAILDTCSSNLMAFFCSDLSSGTNAAVIFTRTSGTFLGGFNPCTPATLLPEDPETLTGSASCTCDLVLFVKAHILTQSWEQESSCTV